MTQPTPEQLGLRLYGYYVGRDVEEWPESVEQYQREHWTLTAVQMDRASRRDLALEMLEIATRGGV
jgi:hypothetical protein